MGDIKMKEANNINTKNTIPHNKDTLHDDYTTHLYDVTYTTTHQRIFKVPSKEWLETFCNDNNMTIITCTEVSSHEE